MKKLGIFISIFLVFIGFLFMTGCTPNDSNEVLQKEELEEVMFQNTSEEQLDILCMFFTMSHERFLAEAAKPEYNINEEAQEIIVEIMKEKCW